MTVEMENIIQYFINQKDRWNKLQLTTWNFSRILINRINIPLLMKHIQEFLAVQEVKTSFWFVSHLKKKALAINVRFQHNNTLNALNSLQTHSQV